MKTKKEKCMLYAYFAEKMLENIEEKPNFLSFKKAKWVLGTQFRIPNELKSVVINEMIDMGLLEVVNCRIYMHKLAVKSRQKILENTSKLYHEAGLW